MNFNLYLFGRNQWTYNQYPNDYTSSLLESFCYDVCSSKAMIVRDHDLIHYIFAEDLGNSNLIGICVIFNKVYIKHVSKFFNYIRGLIESTLLKQGKIIRYNNTGDIEFIYPTLNEDIKSYDFIKTLVGAKLDSENNYFGLTELSSTYNGLHNSETIEGNTSNSEILKLQQKVNKIIIEYNLGIEEDLTKKVISGLQTQISDLNAKIEDQNKTISKLEKTKKQYKKVMFLFVVLLCCCVGLYFLYTTLDKTEKNLLNTTERLKSATDSISSLNDTITENQNTINLLNNEVRNERSLKEKAQNTLENIQTNCPFIVTSSSFNFSKKEYTIKYYSKESGAHTFVIKIIDEKSGHIYSRSVFEYIESGTGSFTIKFSRNLSSSNWYTFEIWYENKIVGGSRH